MKGFKEESVIIEGQYPLAGTLTIPDGPGPFPSVLLVAGSGEVDQDGYAGKMKFFPNFYKDLAELITGLGFITLRVDKRGVGKSGGGYLETGMWDLVDDIEANLAYLENHPQADLDRIIILGHSEGCMLATAANARPVAGMILLAGAGETLLEALARQRRIVFGELMNSKGFKGTLARLFKVDQKGERTFEKLKTKIMASQQDTIRHQLFVRLNAKWFREHFTYNVLDDLRKVTCPVLAIAGSKDIQADPDKLQRVPDLVQGPAECAVIRDMNHMLKEQRGNFRP